MDDFDWGQGARGAAGGAAMGAAFGPVGIGIGAGIGGLAGGLFGGGADVSKYQEQLKQLAAGYGARTAPQGTAQSGQNSGFRSNQAGLIAQLEAMGRGQGPSAAQNQMREAMDRASGAQASAAAGAGGRGVNAGAALRNAANNTAGIQMQGARDSATLRAQEQMSALQQLGGVVGQGRGQDEQMSMFNAGQGNQMTQANMQATLQQLGLNDESQLGALIAAMRGEAGKGPGFGTQLMAGGASAMPGLMQWAQANKAPGAPQGPGGYGGSGIGGSIIDPSAWGQGGY